MSCILKIGNRKIGDNFKPFIICELGINHHGSLMIAKKMVDFAFNAGADAIKNQSHILDKEMIPEDGANIAVCRRCRTHCKYCNVCHK